MNYQKLIEEVIEVVGEDNTFVNSLQSFLNRNDYLTEKQVNALEKILNDHDDNQMALEGYSHD